jgi:DNA-binding transcriptional ArsR family regulator
MRDPAARSSLPPVGARDRKGTTAVTSDQKQEPARPRPATMKDIAKAVGVAQSTVSRWLKSTK